MVFLQFAFLFFTRQRLKNIFVHVVGISPEDSLVFQGYNLFQGQNLPCLGAAELCGMPEDDTPFHGSSSMWAENKDEIFLGKGADPGGWEFWNAGRWQMTPGSSQHPLGSWVSAFQTYWSLKVMVIFSLE